MSNTEQTLWVQSPAAVSKLGIRSWRQWVISGFWMKALNLNMVTNENICGQKSTEQKIRLWTLVAASLRYDWEMIGEGRQLGKSGFTNTKSSFKKGVWAAVLDATVRSNKTRTNCHWNWQFEDKLWLHGEEFQRLKSDYNKKWICREEVKKVSIEPTTTCEAWL